MDDVLVCGPARAVHTFGLDSAREAWDLFSNGVDCLVVPTLDALHFIYPFNPSRNKALVFAREIKHILHNLGCLLVLLNNGWHLIHLNDTADQSKEQIFHSIVSKHRAVEQLVVKLHDDGTTLVVKDECCFSSRFDRTRHACAQSGGTLFTVVVGEEYVVALCESKIVELCKVVPGKAAGGLADAKFGDNNCNNREPDARSYSKRSDLAKCFDCSTALTDDDSTLFVAQRNPAGLHRITTHDGKIQRVLGVPAFLDIAIVRSTLFGSRNYHIYAVELPPDSTAALARRLAGVMLRTL